MDGWMTSLGMILERPLRIIQSPLNFNEENNLFAFNISSSVVALNTANFTPGHVSFEGPTLSLFGQRGATRRPILSELEEEIILQCTVGVVRFHFPSINRILLLEVNLIVIIPQLLHGNFLRT